MDTLKSNMEVWAGSEVFGTVTIEKDVSYVEGSDSYSFDLDITWADLLDVVSDYTRIPARTLQVETRYDPENERIVHGNKSYKVLFGTELDNFTSDLIRLGISYKEWSSIAHESCFQIEVDEGYEAVTFWLIDPLKISQTLYHLI